MNEILLKKTKVRIIQEIANDSMKGKYVLDRSEHIQKRLSEDEGLSAYCIIVVNSINGLMKDFGLIDDKTLLFLLAGIIIRWEEVLRRGVLEHLKK